MDSFSISLFFLRRHEQMDVNATHTPLFVALKS